MPVYFPSWLQDRLKKPLLTRIVAESFFLAVEGRGSGCVFVCFRVVLYYP